MVRRGALVLLVVALVAGAAVAWRILADDEGDDGEATARLDCPIDLVPGLPRTPDPELEADGLRLRLVWEMTEATSLSVQPGTGHVVVTVRGGFVVRLDDDGERTVVVDVTGKVTHSGSEQGLVGSTFNPDGDVLYLDYTDLDNNTQVLAVEVDEDAQPTSDLLPILKVEQPGLGHNAGGLLFDDEGHFYVTLGNGAHPVGPEDRAQDTSEPLGSILRLEARPGEEPGYAVPDDNPFVGRAGADPRIWVYGLRNPWRISIDRTTDTMWIADVGDSCFEEINRIPLDGGGANFGWDRVEGVWVADPPAPPDAVTPAYAYLRTNEGGCAVVGGFVYRGQAMPELQGHYLFTDYCSGEVLALDTEASTPEVRPLGMAVSRPTSFGEGLDGEPWVLSIDDGVYRLEPASP